MGNTRLRVKVVIEPEELKSAIPEKLKEIGLELQADSEQRGLMRYGRMVRGLWDMDAPVELSAELEWYDLIPGLCKLFGEKTPRLMEDYTNDLIPFMLEQNGR